VIDTVVQAPAWTAVVVTTACDQMRYAASVLEHRDVLPVFLMNVPSTWQTAAARSLYAEELRRLGRFLVRLGGRSPAGAELAEVMLRFDGVRARLRRDRQCWSARRLAEALIAVREGTEESGDDPAPRGFEANCSRHTPCADCSVPLALVGGPLVERDYRLLDWIEAAGGRVALDASEWGERTLPRPFDPQAVPGDPLTELADAYFGIPDVFRRPNDPCYEYLRGELAAGRLRGFVFRRYLWCDLWHAELSRLSAWSPVPVLDLDVADREDLSEGRTRGRIEAFLEMLAAGGGQ
jgi:benzoyl-CoA reductase/2-hydroxyglutaryl-CoA dehydratase subunit BcrC/BadD/HgdB